MSVAVLESQYNCALERSWFHAHMAKSYGLLVWGQKRSANESLACFFAISS